jgi:nitrous oxidase accessory protein NosD
MSRSSSMTGMTWLLAAVLATTTLAARAETIPVGPGQSIQAAIDLALPGDVIAVAAGEYAGDLDFLGKAITVTGAPGWASVVRGTGTGPVVTFASGEGPGSVLDGFTITGGVAPRGGGIFVAGSSPFILRNKVFDNLAGGSGSGIHLEDSSAWVWNNAVVWNRSAGGDPHNLQVVRGAPVIVNNTVVRGDSNGILVSGASGALILNNIIAFNAGRGICDFSPGTASIHYNVFFRNRKAALLTGGVNWDRIESAQAAIGLPRLLGNRDVRPGFDPDIPKGVASGSVDYGLAADAAARDVGHPHPLFADANGTRNDAGSTGGPLGIEP